MKLVLLLTDKARGIWKTASPAGPMSVSPIKASRRRIKRGSFCVKADMFSMWHLLPLCGAVQTLWIAYRK